MALVLGFAASTVAGAEADTRPVVVIAEGDASAWATELRQAIGRELRTQAIAPEDPRAKTSRGTLLVSLSTADEEVLVRYKPVQGSEIARRVRAPADHARAVRATTLLAGNLVRNEAQEILDAARKPQGPATGAASGSVPGATPNPTAEDEAAKAADAGAGDAGAKPGEGDPHAPAPGDPHAAKPGDPAGQGGPAGQGAAGKPGDAPGANPPTSLTPPPLATKLTPIERPCVKRHAGEPFMPIIGSLVHPVATNFNRPHARTAFALSLIYGRAGQIKGADIGVASNVDCDVEGAQMQLAVSRVGGEVRGFQLSGLASIADETVKGVQASLVFDRANRVEGLQIGGVNVAKEVDGAQMGVVNIARNADGPQLGLSNAAENVPVQIGIVNVGRKVAYAQIGLVNVASDADVQVGFFSFSKTSYIRPVAWIGSSTYRSINAGVRFDTRWVYAQLYFGYVDGSKVNDFVTGGALGFHVLKPDQEGFLLDLENGTQQRFGEKTEENDNLRQMAHIVAGWRVSKRLAFFAGMGIVFAQRKSDSFVGPDVLAGTIF
ncbi:hypothetical protein [Pendulispora albinea]|uniref:Uncharacterized protein n=1 Tax=Pendulispora albinea TaxID=2741071 RepID=A0ABZ2LWQ1_9BACT